MEELNKQVQNDQRKIYFPLRQPLDITPNIRKNAIDRACKALQMARNKPKHKPRNVVVYPLFCQRHLSAIHLPNMQAVNRLIRNENLKKDYKNGVSYMNLAQKYGISERWTRHLCKCL
ncbi:MAG: hypothetical protein ACRCY4_08945, partial [Brevinema sp.]